MRIGNGFDIHRLCEGRRLILGGVQIDCGYGLLGHSDADVLTHAVMDAVLGAAGLRDIGVQFPDTEERFKDICSLKLLEQVQSLINPLRVHSLDCTVVAQKPRISQFIPEMTANLSRILCCEYVNVKATTAEGLGSIGRCEGISAYAVCLLK